MLVEGAAWRWERSTLLRNTLAIIPPASEWLLFWVGSTMNLLETYPFKLNQLIVYLSRLLEEEKFVQVMSVIYNDLLPCETCNY